MNNQNRNLEVYRGDIFYITAGSYVGSEQKSGRPGIIVSNDTANKHSPNVEVVFLTSQEKKPLPTHVEVICKVPSTALCENIQTVSKERLGDFVKSLLKCGAKASVLGVCTLLHVMHQRGNAHNAVKIKIM